MLLPPLHQPSNQTQAQSSLLNRLMARHHIIYYPRLLLLMIRDNSNAFYFSIEQRQGWAERRRHWKLSVQFMQVVRLHVIPRRPGPGGVPAITLFAAAATPRRPRGIALGTASSASRRTRVPAMNSSRRPGGGGGGDDGGGVGADSAGVFGAGRQNAGPG